MHLTYGLSETIRLLQTHVAKFLTHFFQKVGGHRSCAEGAFQEIAERAENNSSISEIVLKQENDIRTAPFFVSSFLWASGVQ